MACQCATEAHRPSNCSLGEDEHRFTEHQALPSQREPSACQDEAVRQAHETTSRDGLRVLRILFAAFVLAIVAIGVVVVILEATAAFESSDLSPGLVAAGLAILGAASQFTLPVVRPGLDCSSDRRLAATYRTRLVVGLAVSETPALLGFAAFILTGEPLLYLLGAAVTAVGFARVAPSRRSLDRDQDDLTWNGCSRSLVEVLRRHG
jgi:hypothetical protein